jgi:carbonic anhydrase
MPEAVKKNTGMRTMQCTKLFRSGASPEHRLTKEADKSVKKPWCYLMLLLAGVGAWAQGSPAGPAADEALTKLMAGNQRYVRHEQKHPHQSLARRKELGKGQHPFAVILGCADSRVSPELLFDEGLGDLFVIRVAGNIVDDAILGSIEYAVEHLGIKLVIVLGHEKCGAVSAAVEGGIATGHIQAVMAAIQPSVEASGKEPGDRIKNCVIANARRVARQVRESEPVLKESVEKHGVKVVAADYALDSGKVNLLDAAQP